MATGGMEMGTKFSSLGVDEKLVKILQTLGWVNPSKIHEAIPYALEGKDIIGFAQIGLGVAEAIAIPIIQLMTLNPYLNPKLNPKPVPLTACVLTPTRRRASEISKLFQKLGRDISIKCTMLVSGEDFNEQKKDLKNYPHVMVGTPMRTWEHLCTDECFTRCIKYMVFDEADTLLGRFEKEIKAILNHTSNVKKQRRYMFSSTMSKKVDRFKCFLNDPVQINSTINELKQEFILVPAKDKDCYLLHILEVMSCSAMIFTSTCEGAVVLSLVLENLGLRAISIHDQMNRAQRLKTLYQFTSGVCRILVCTDTASRHHNRTVVDMVVNYDIPPISEDYIHRVGRAAKAGDSGRAISLVSKNEVDWYTDIEHLIGKKLPAFPLELGEVSTLSERVSNAQAAAKMDMKKKYVLKKRKERSDK